MKEKEFSFSGIIDKNYKKKTLIKINSIVIPFFVLITLFFVAVTLGGTDVEARERGPTPEGPIANIIGVSDLLFWLILFVVIVPYIIIMIISSIHISIYIRNYTFEVSESHITIYHGVFTKTKAIIPVHIAGQPCDMEPIIETFNLTKEYRLKKRHKKILGGTVSGRIRLCFYSNLYDGLSRVNFLGDGEMKVLNPRQVLRQAPRRSIVAPWLIVIATTRAQKCSQALC